MVQQHKNNMYKARTGTGSSVRAEENKTMFDITKLKADDPDFAQNIKNVFSQKKDNSLEMAIIIEACVQTKNNLIAIGNLMKLKEALVANDQYIHAAYVCTKAIELCPTKNIELLLDLAKETIHLDGENMNLVSKMFDFIKKKNLLTEIIQDLLSDDKDGKIAKIIASQLSRTNQEKDVEIQVKAMEHEQNKHDSKMEELIKKVEKLEKQLVNVDHVVSTSTRSMFQEFDIYSQCCQDSVEDRAVLYVQPADIETELDTGDVVCCVIRIDDGRTIATSHASLGEIQVWDLQKKERIRAFGKNLPGMHNVWEIKAMKYTDHIISASPDTPGLKVFNWKTGELVNEINHDFAISGFGHSKMFTFGGRYVGVGLQDSTVTIFDTKVPGGAVSLKLKGHDDWVFTCEVCPNGRLVTGSGGTLLFWNVQKKIKEYFIEAHVGYVTALGLLNNETLLSGSSLGDIKMWDLKSKCCMRILLGHKCTIYQLSLLGKNLAASAGNDGTLRLWDLTTTDEVKRFKFDKAITSMTYCPKTYSVILGSSDHKVRVIKPQHHPDRHNPIKHYIERKKETED